MKVCGRHLCRKNVCIFDLHIQHADVKHVRISMPICVTFMLMYTHACELVHMYELLYYEHSHGHGHMRLQKPKSAAKCQKIKRHQKIKRPIPISSPAPYADPFYGSRVESERMYTIYHICIYIYIYIYYM